jgi:hypothetical protein
MGDIKPIGTLKPIGAVDSGVKPVGNLKPIGVIQEPIEKDAFTLVQEQQDAKGRVDEVVNSITDLDDSKKNYIKKLAINGVKGEDLSNSILTLQGKHPNQEDGRFYYDNSGIPRPLKKGEAIPNLSEKLEYLSASRQKDAEDDGSFTSAGKHIVNGVMEGVNNMVRLSGLPYALVTGEEADYVKTAERNLEISKEKTPSSENVPLIDVSKVKGYGDIFNLDNYSADGVKGMVFGGLESITSFLTASAMTGGIGELAAVSGEATGLLSETGGVSKFLTGASRGGQLSKAYTASYATNYTEALSAAENAGLEGRDKIAFASIVTAPIALVDIMFGTEGLFVKNQIAKNARKQGIEALAKGIEKEGGEALTKESLEKLFNEATKQAVNEQSFVKQAVGNIVEEGATESGQAAILNASEQIYDSLKKDPKFNTQTFSPQSIAEYLNEFAAGAIGGGAPGLAFVSQERKIERDKKSSENAFNIVRQGTQAVEATRLNVAEALKRGEITESESEAILTKLNAFNDYNNQTRDLKIDDAKKRELFDLTFQKENLESKLRVIGDKEKLQPIGQGIYNSIEKESQAIQKQINDLILESQIKDEIVVSDKTIQDQIKKEQPKKDGEKKVEPKNPALKALLGRMKSDGTETAKKEDKRSYDEIDAKEWNHKSKMSYRDKHAKLAESMGDKVIVGKLSEDQFIDNFGDEPKINETYSVELPDGKKMKFASTMTREEGFKGHFRQEFFPEFDEKNMVGVPIAIKAVEVPAIGEGSTSKKAIKAFRTDNGKTVGWLKATNTGKKKEFTDEQEEWLKDEEIKLNDIPPSSESKGETKPPVKPTPKPNVKGVATKQDFVNQRIEELQNDPDADFDQDLADSGTYEYLFGNEYDKIYGKTNQTENAQSVSQEESVARPSKESTDEGSKQQKTKKLGTGKKKRSGVIKHSEKVEALKHEVFDPYGLALQYFIGNGRVAISSINKLFKNSKAERDKRISYFGKNARTIEQIAEYIIANNEGLILPMDEVVNAVEDVVIGFHSPTEMARALNEVVGKNSPENNPVQDIINEISEIADEKGIGEELNQAISELEQLDDESLKKLDQDENWEGDTSDIISDDGTDTPFQKFSSVEGDAIKVAEHIQKVMPKIKVVIDPTMIVAGKLSADGKTISINPFYAGIDTPIHEAGHVLIDAIGYNNKTIQDAIKQLKGTKLWSDTKSRYSELNEEMLGKEVLAEAIGREGAGIFAKESQTSRFKAYLSYIFDWFKRKLGLDKNIAKSLAKQIIAGVRTKQLAGTDNKVEQKQIISANANLEEYQQRALETAVLMETEGKSAEEIYQATGWERGFDGIFRYDLIENQDDFLLNDSILNLINDFLTKTKERFSIKLGKLSPNANVFKAYPDLKNLKVEFYDDPKNETEEKAKGIYDSGTNSIRINATSFGLGDRGRVNGRTANTDGGIHTKERRLRGLRGILLHEIQHAIQKIDFLEPGGEPNQKLADKLKKKLISENKELPDDLPKEAYLRLAGEVEARNATYRTSLSEENRVKTPISETESFKRSEQISAIPGKEQVSLDDFDQKEFNLYRKKIGRDIKEEKELLKALEDAIENEDLSEEDLALAESERDNILDQIEADKQAYIDYLKTEESLDKIENSTSLEDIPLDELIKTYQAIYDEAKANETYPDRAQLKKIKERIGYVLNNIRKEELEKQYGKEITELANQRDLTGREFWTKSMGNISQEFPAIQELYNEFNQANLDREKERYKLKTELEKAGKAVIREVNKKNGVIDWAKGLVTSNSAKYFQFVENNGKLLTIEEGRKKGLSDAQINFLKIMRELVSEQNKISGKETNGDLQVIKTDQGFWEAFGNGGFMEAVSLYMGGGNNVDVEVTYTNPNTGKTEKVPYKEAQRAILSYAEKGLKQKGIAVGKLLSLAYKAKKAAYKSPYNINYGGMLTSKFDKEYDKPVGYSKDYYAAAMQLIDDITHVKHMNKVVPLADSVELFYQRLGVDRKDEGKAQMQYGNILKYIKEWKDEQIYQRTKEIDPFIDLPLSFFRRLTSMTIMAFNAPAAVMNVVIGNYNNFRAEGGKYWLKGQGRFFGGKDRAGYGTVSKKAVNILDRYNVVSSDLDSNPKAHIGKLFEMLSFGATRFGEYQIQGSMFLGQMTDEEWNSFDENGNIKPGVDEKALMKKITQYKDEVSNIQGKYNPKDRRMFMRSELGKSAAQFKNWMPDWWRERFGSEYYDSKGVLHRGSYNMFTKQAIKELKEDWNRYNIATAWKNKQARQNLTEAMFIGALYVMTHSGDEDEKKRKQALSLENALEQILFVYDPSQLKYLLKSPVASIGTVEKFINALEAMMKGDSKNFNKNAKKLIPYNKSYDLVAGDTKK